MLAKLKEKKWWLMAGTPVCFVAVYACMLLVPNKYTSTLIITREDEHAQEKNRTFTLNMPINYDLGVVRTANAISQYGYEDVMQSDAFIASLLDVPVKTANGIWEGSYREYLLTQAPHPFWSCINPADSVTIYKHYSKQEVDMIAATKKAITTEIDDDSYNLTIHVSTTDPLVSTMLAEALNNHLNLFIQSYEQAKMTLAAEQLEEVVRDAEEAYLQAKANRADTEVKKEVLESFKRQLVVYKAQSMYQPAYATLCEPTYSYEKASPHRATTALTLTIVYVFILCCVVYRKELISRI